jgi:membrane protease YdiL (CAAX protease family)
MLGVAMAVLGQGWLASRQQPKHEAPPLTLSEDLSYRASVALSQPVGVHRTRGRPEALRPHRRLEAQAITGYETHLRHFPDDPAAHLRMGVILGRKQLPKYARQHLERARKNDQSHAALYDALILLYSNPDPSPQELRKARPALDAAPAWLRDLVLPDLYRKAGDTKMAQASEKAARQRGEVFLAKLALVSAGTLALVFAGLGVLGVWLITRASQARKARPAPAPLPRWSVLDFVEALAFWLFASTVFGLLAGGVAPTGDRPGLAPSAQTWAMVAAYVPPGLLMLLVLWVRAAGRQTPFPQAAGWVGPPWAKRLLGGLAGYAAAVPLVLVAALMGQRFAPVDPFSTNPAIPVIVSAQSLWSRLALLGLVAVAAPIVEETLFRGVAYSAFRARWGPGWGIVLSATLFAAMHHSLAVFLPLFALGAVFAYLYEVTGSIVPCMVAHACQNGLTALALWVIATM